VADRIIPKSSVKEVGVKALAEKLWFPRWFDDPTINNVSGPENA
jgi:hypothetical protein